jgi:hypothetical protein
MIKTPTSIAIIDFLISYVPQFHQNLISLMLAMNLSLMSLIYFSDKGRFFIVDTF